MITIGYCNTTFSYKIGTTRVLIFAVAMERMTIIENLQKRRKSLGYSQEEMAEKLGISLTSYRKIENGTTSLVSKRVFQIASILGIEPQKLLFGYDSSGESGLLKEEYDLTIASLQTQAEDLKEKVRMLEELVKAKNEIISMLKSSEKKEN